MDTLLSLFEAAERLSPLAIIGLLVGLLCLVLVKHRQGHAQVEDMRSNDLHELHELHDMAETLRRIEVQQMSAFATILAKLNGG